jgi:hypothetical protein
MLSESNENGTYLGNKYTKNIFTFLTGKDHHKEHQQEMYNNLVRHAEMH